MIESNRIHELERLLNRLRWKYLRAIRLSPRLCRRPSRAISHAFNEAFLSLCGLGDPSERASGSLSAWESCGFAEAAHTDLAWEEELTALEDLLKQFAEVEGPQTARFYAELIALKPGFHEAWLHQDFPEDIFESPDTPRGRIFAMLRGSASGLIDPGDGLSEEVSTAATFLGYSPCTITEGPLVRRKHPEVSYFEALARVGTKPLQADRRIALARDFQVLDPVRRIERENHVEGLAQLIGDIEAGSYL